MANAVARALFYDREGSLRAYRMAGEGREGTNGRSLKAAYRFGGDHPHRSSPTADGGGVAQTSRAVDKLQCTPAESNHR